MSFIHLTLSIVEFLLQTAQLVSKVVGGLHMLRSVCYLIGRGLIRYGDTVVGEV